MGSKSKPAPRILFGPFEFDGSSGELRKHQTKLRLTGQPLRILELLLESPKQVLSREELQQRLWSDTTFVDFEHGLNAAVNRLRQTLGDSADQPRYIETLPGRGYRFIGEFSYSSVRPLLEMVTSPTGVAGSEDALKTQAVLGRGNRSLNNRALWLGAAVIGLALLAVTVAVRLRSPGFNPVARTVRFRMTIPEGMSLSGSQTFSLSPDGRTLVYLANAIGNGLLLWTQSLDSIEPRVLTNPHSPSDAPVFWSPDSKFVVFYSDQQLKKIDFSGNPAQVIGPVPGIVLGGSWNREGTIIFGTETTGIQRINANGGRAVDVTLRNPERGERVHVFPNFLPDGRHFLYSRQSAPVENSGIFIGSLDAKPAEQSLTRLIATPFACQFVASQDGNGVVLFLRDAVLWAQDFDSARLQLRGEPRKVVEPVGGSRAFGFFASSNGTLVHRNGLTQIGQLTWVDRHGRHLDLVGQPSDLWNLPPRISPDGKRIAVTKFDGRNVDLWVHHLDRDVVQRITFDPAIHESPVWSPDGKRLAYSSSRAGHYDLYATGAGGEGHEELLYASSENKFATSWSTDGRFLLYETESGRVWLLPVESRNRTPVSFTRSRANEGSAVFSPDSGWIAYTSNESGTSEVYLRPFLFPGANPADGAKVLVSRGGGSTPRWRADGKEIFYRGPARMVMSAAVVTGGAFHLGVAQNLFPLPGVWWDAAGDGNRFLVNLAVEQGVPPFTVVVNWLAEWKK